MQASQQTEYLGSIAVKSQSTFRVVKGAIMQDQPKFFLELFIRLPNSKLTF